MKKRYRSPKPKDNTLTLQWSKLPDCEPDIVTTWGKGCNRADSRLLMNTIGDKTFIPGSFESIRSLKDELEYRGYDIETIKFSIKKKTQDTN